MLNALIVLYFVDQLRLLTELLPLLGRLVFGAEMLGGTLFLSWFVWTKRSPAVNGNITKLFARAIRFAIQIGLLLFPVTFLAIVFGYVNFANLLGGGVIRSWYVGAAVYTALRIVEGLIIISLGTRPLGLMRAASVTIYLRRRHRPLLKQWSTSIRPIHRQQTRHHSGKNPKRIYSKKMRFNYSVLTKGDNYVDSSSVAAIHS
jgi:hypothetical protein